MVGSVPDHGELAAQITHAYERLVTTRRALVMAADALSEHERHLKVANADALLEAKNERTATLYLEGLLDTPEHSALLTEKSRAELAHYEARSEVARLELLVRLLEASARD